MKKYNSWRLWKDETIWVSTAWEKYSAYFITGRPIDNSKNKNLRSPCSIIGGLLDWKPYKVGIIIHALPYSTDIVIFLIDIKTIKEDITSFQIDFRHFNGYRWYLICDFNLSFPVDNGVVHLFICSLITCMSVYFMHSLKLGSLLSYCIVRVLKIF